MGSVISRLASVTRGKSRRPGEGGGGSWLPTWRETIVICIISHNVKSIDVQGFNKCLHTERSINDYRQRRGEQCGPLRTEPSFILSQVYSKKNVNLSLACCTRLIAIFRIQKCNLLVTAIDPYLNTRHKPI